MARECFCGCGRRIPKFPLGMRAINKRGQLVAERLAWGSDLAGEDNPELGDWVAEGRIIVEDIKAGMHGEIDPRSLDESRVRDWQVFGRRMEQVAVEMGLPSVNEWLAGLRREPARDEQEP